MKTEIEQIMQADDDAYRKIEAAKAESHQIRLGARQQAAEIEAQKREELARARGEELQRVLHDAAAKATTILADADRYVQKLEEKKIERSEALLNELLTKMIGP